MITFAEGSLNFMANFDVKEHEEVINLLFCSKKSESCMGMGIDSRSRININTCGRFKDPKELEECGFFGGEVEDQERDMYFGANLDPIIAAKNKWTIKDRNILNEVVVDRGPSPW